MEKTIKQLREYISAISLPIEDSKTAISLKEKIIALLDKLFSNNLGDMYFQTILVNDVVKPLCKKNEEIESINLDNSQTKQYLKTQYSQVKALVDFVFEYYKAFLKDETEYIEYIKNLLVQKDRKERALLRIIDYKENPEDFDLLESSEKAIENHLSNLNRQHKFRDLYYLVKEIYNKIKITQKTLRSKINNLEIKTDKVNNKPYNNLELSAYEMHYELLTQLESKITTKYNYAYKKASIAELGKFISNNKIDKLIFIEDLLIENNYLEKNGNGLKWIKKKNELVNFCRFLKIKNFLKDNKNKISPFIVFMENRYNTSVGDQRKESKFNGDDKDIIKDFEHLSYTP
ncbi:hypothetical protein J2X97_000432 [Epilithonimonas hungarica]|uniref:hypothetical protein n=1 Tax=Epilithonimonas hungarica TaxID=454006 RepID=UPI00278B5573|nr:hypothetical protein [Epilithonimonas hungarica]MDP9954795.1 hypothetical protein [Epilithonimonas hungarica]